MVKLVAVLLLFFVVAPIGLFFALRWLARRWYRRRPSRASTARVTRTGLFLATCQTAVLVVIVAVAKLDPAGPVGEFLSQPGGIIAGLFLAMIVFGYVDLALEKRGHPSLREMDHHDAPTAEATLPDADLNREKP